MEQGINERIKIAIQNSIYKNVNAFARHSGIAQVTLCNYVNAKRTPNVAIVISILEKLPDLSAEWLMRGEGPMLKSGGGVAQVGDVDASGVGNAVAVGGGATATAAAAPSADVEALRAERDRLADEVKWLRGVLAQTLGKC